MRYAVWVGFGLVCLSAQGQDQIRQATIRGSGGSSGKCTVEVRVDVAAEVDLYGDSGRLRTLGGQPATWTRFECSGALPRNMADFRFRGVDGRGQARLAQDPRNNNGVAVIRIEDPKGGSEGYTFDIEWSGASGGAPTGGFPTGGGFGGDDNRRGFPGQGRGRGRGITAERAIDLCRAEVRARAEREYNLRNIDITSAAADTGAGRTDWVTGSFTERGGFRRGGTYRFNCAVDYEGGQVRNVEILGSDGRPLSPSTGGGQSGYDQQRVYRACQDAVVQRTGRDGYQNVNFRSIAIDPNRNGTVSGTITAARGPVSDTFDFSCSMDMGNATVRNVQVNRR